MKIDRLWILCTALLTVGSSAGTQIAAEAATVTPPEDMPLVPPSNLTGDRGAIQLRPGETFVPWPGGGPPPWDRGPLAPGPTLALAIEAAQAAIGACASIAHARVGVAIIDSAGQPRVTLAADGVRGWHIYSGLRKALTALALKEASSKAVEDAAANPAVAALIKPNMTTIAGAVPLQAGGEVVGAIGVSGAPSGTIDEQCAMIGASQIQSRLIQ